MYDKWLVTDIDVTFDQASFISRDKLCSQKYDFVCVSRKKCVVFFFLYLLVCE